MTASCEHITESRLPMSIERIPVQDVIDLERRIAVFGDYATMVSGAAEIWSLIEPRCDEIAKLYVPAFQSWMTPEQFVMIGGEPAVIAIAVKYHRLRLSGLDRHDWVIDLDRITRQALALKRQPHEILSLISSGSGGLLALLREAVNEDRDRVIRLGEIVLRLSILETDIAGTIQSGYAQAKAQLERKAAAESYRRKFIANIGAIAKAGKPLRGLANSAAQAARGMRSKSSEVAVAAEQSALAMREAASTAAGLI